MIDLYELKKICNTRYRCFYYCIICKHKNDTHWGNCIECCPVRLNEIKDKSVIQMDCFDMIGEVS